jgi:Chaperone of endosialidase
LKTQNPPALRISRPSSTRLWAGGWEAGSAVTTANSVICIGANVDGENVSNSCYIGQIYSNVQPQVGTDPDLVTINSSGRLGRANVSSRRYKHDIKPMHEASEAIYALKPVSFRYHKQYDETQRLAFGLIAEEVAEVAPALVGRNQKGEPESVRYDQVNAMLLNEFLKEHARVEEQDRKTQNQEATITQLKRDVAALVARLEEHDSKIQKVTDQLD